MTYTDKQRGGVTYEAAIESITLLKNDGSPPVFPFPQHTQKSRLFGPLADGNEDLLGNYQGMPSLLSHRDKESRTLALT
jgi:beta-glucosidase-like glycosyl hydrolase